MILSLDEMRQALLPFGVSPDAALGEKIRLYVELLLRWNQKINLTAITTPAEILERHFGECFFGAQFLDLSARQIVDIGSGAGFPGLAIKMILPGACMTLIEANKRKAAFLKEVAKSLEMHNVEVVALPLSDLNLRERHFDHVLCRAVGTIMRVLGWSEKSLRTGGSILLWSSMKDVERICQDPRWGWEGPFKIPRSNTRVLLRGRLT